MLNQSLEQDLRIAREAYSDVIEEGKPILEEHWRELAFYPDIPLDPDYDVYAALEKQNLISIYTVRVRGELVGYAIYFVRKHHHYRTVSWAVSDIILVRKNFRNYGIGTALFAFAENDLRAQGVQVMHTTTKYCHPELGMLLQSRGHQREGFAYTLRL
jgi:GNAT superfamily N-acetyltransferase